jgi:hypothetical protein
LEAAPVDSRGDSLRDHSALVQFGFEVGENVADLGEQVRFDLAPSIAFVAPE